MADIQCATDQVTHFKASIIRSAIAWFSRQQSPDLERAVFCVTERNGSGSHRFKREACISRRLQALGSFYVTKTTHKCKFIRAAPLIPSFRNETVMGLLECYSLQIVMY